MGYPTDEPIDFSLPNYGSKQSNLNIMSPNFSLPNYTPQSSNVIPTFAEATSKIPTPASEPTWFQNAFGSKDSTGWVSPTFGAISGMASAALGYQQLQLGKQQLEQNKKVFNMNFGAQAQATNRDLEERQRMRVKSDSSNEAVDSYMKRNAVSTQGL